MILSPGVPVSHVIFIRPLLPPLHSHILTGRVGPSVVQQEKLTSQSTMWLCALQAWRLCLKLRPSMMRTSASGAQAEMPASLRAWLPASHVGCVESQVTRHLIAFKKLVPKAVEMEVCADARFLPNQ